MNIKMISTTLATARATPAPAAAPAPTAPVPSASASSSAVAKSAVDAAMINRAEVTGRTVSSSVTRPQATAIDPVSRNHDSGPVTRAKQDPAASLEVNDPIHARQKPELPGPGWLTLFHTDSRFGIPGLPGESGLPDIAGWKFGGPGRPGGASDIAGFPGIDSGIPGRPGSGSGIPGFPGSGPGMPGGDITGFPGADSGIPGFPGGGSGSGIPGLPGGFEMPGGSDIDQFGPRRGFNIKFKGSDAGQNVTVPKGDPNWTPGTSHSPDSEFVNTYGQVGKAAGQIAGSEVGGEPGKQVGGKIGEELGKAVGTMMDAVLPSFVVVSEDQIAPANSGSQGSTATGGQSAGTTGGYSKDPNAQTGGSSDPKQSSKPANQSPAPASSTPKKEEPKQSTDPNQSKKPENQSPAGKPNPNGMPADDSGGGGTPYSSAYRPADDSGGGGTPYSSLYTPADDGGPVGPNLRSHLLSRQMAALS